MKREQRMDPRRERELRALEQALGVEFRKLAYLDEALTHTSYANESRRHIASNERLEFLGDAVLELASSTYLYRHFPKLSEGELTKIRASIVCSATLSRLAEGLGLGEALLLGHGEDLCGGRHRASNLEDAFEAVIGAIYLDQGWNAAEDYVCRQLASEFVAAEQGRTLRDSKTILQEVVQRNPSSHISYVEIDATGPDHDRSYRFEVRIDGATYGTGAGRSKKEAEQMAAKEALQRLGEG